jgi:hypothetical protein
MVRLAQKASARVIAVDDFPRETAEYPVTSAVKSKSPEQTKTDKQIGAL